MVVVMVIILMFLMVLLQMVALVADVRNLTRQVLGDRVFKIVHDHLDEVSTIGDDDMFLLLQLLFCHYYAAVFMPPFPSVFSFFPIHCVTIYYFHIPFSSCVCHHFILFLILQLLFFCYV